jgi:hypothetical protein
MLAIGIYWPGDQSRLKIIGNDSSENNDVKLGKLVVSGL